jgi:hypothetical protein
MAWGGGFAPAPGDRRSPLQVDTLRQHGCCRSCFTGIGTGEVIRVGGLRHHPFDEVREIVFARQFSFTFGEHLI